MQMTIAIVGLGLIGGSFAKAIKTRTPHRVLGFDKNEAVLKNACENGAIDDIFSDFSGVSLVLIALYPGDTVNFIKEHASSFQSGTTVIDLCGVKRFICKNAEGIFPQDVTFIGGHPMAGLECSGFENAVPTLFDGASMILTPDKTLSSDIIEPLCGFFKEIGFTHIEITTDTHHDEMISYTSQLAHIVSSAYIKSPTARGYMGFSAGSFADMTRVAKLNEDMWSELFLHNGDFLCQQIQVMIDNLTDFRDAITNKDASRLRGMLREGREIKEMLES